MNYRKECETLTKNRTRKMADEAFQMFRFGYDDGAARNSPKELPDPTGATGIVLATMNLMREFYMAGYNAGAVEASRKEG